MEKKQISTSSENYLEVIYELGKDGQGVRSVDVAKCMQVSKASVNKAIGVLRQAGMVDQQLYGMITLTDQGYKRAQEVSHRHHMIKLFLMEILNVDEETADEDACGMEHVISDITMRRWTEYIEKVLENQNIVEQEENLLIRTYREK